MSLHEPPLNAPPRFTNLAKIARRATQTALCTHRGVGLCLRCSEMRVPTNGRMHSAQRLSERQYRLPYLRLKAGTHVEDPRSYPSLR